MMNLFKRNKSKNTAETPLLVKPVVSGSCFVQDEHELLLIEKIIEIVKTTPNDFTARWWDGKSLEKSVQSKNKEILILISNGQILHPIEVKMTEEQKATLKTLIEPIVKKDSEYIINRLVSNYR